MDTNTLARLRSLLKDIENLESQSGDITKMDMRILRSLLLDTITGNYDYVGAPMKDEQAFKDKHGICYIPEASDQAYTYFDIAAITCNNHETTERVFQLCEWQHPDTIFEEGVREGEWNERGEILIK